MARIRYIKPDFFEDFDLGQLPPLYRIAFIGLWCHADKAGRLKDKPEELKIKILPYDEVDFNEILNKLSLPKKNKTSFISRYGVNDVPHDVHHDASYIQINKFAEHQRPHHTEKESIIPPMKITVKKRLRHRDIPLGRGMEKGMEKGMESDQRATLCSSFNLFWTKYPRKVGKATALKTWLKLKPDDGLLQKILESIEKQKESQQWQDMQFIPHPATWLNQKRWEDEDEQNQRWSVKED